jgi:uncharacterized protein (TIGR03435 family)
MRLFAGMLITCVFAFAQERGTPTPLKFEVASVKRSPPDARPGPFGCHGTDARTGMPLLVPLGRCVYRHINFRNLIVQAFPNLPISFRAVAGIDAQVTGGPGWIGGSFFDIEGKAADAATTTSDQLREMLHTLLKDRFQLDFHMETKELAAYAMVSAKDGPKLKESAGPVTAEEAGRRHARSLYAADMTLSDFAALLSIYVKTPVVDKTGLTRKYTITLNSLETGDDTAASIFTAMPEQLGLRLESQKIQFPVFVIDHLEKPTEN